MSEIERTVPGTPGITKEAGVFNNDFELDNIAEGIRTAQRLNTKVIETEKVQSTLEVQNENNEKEIPTGADIRKAYNEGTYREYTSEER